MRWVSLGGLGLSTLAVLAVDWILLVDVVGADMRLGSADWVEIVVGVVIAVLLLGFPTILGGWLHRRSHPVWATVVAGISLALSWGALNVLAAGFTP